MTPEKKALVMVALKEKGLDVAEEALAATVKSSFDLLEVITPIFSAGLGAVVPSIRNVIEKPILAAVDKIDGQDDEGR